MRRSLPSSSHTVACRRVLAEDDPRGSAPRRAAPRITTVTARTVGAQTARLALVCHRNLPSRERGGRAPWTRARASGVPAGSARCTQGARYRPGRSTRPHATWSRTPRTPSCSRHRHRVTPAGGGAVASLRLLPLQLPQVALSSRRMFKKAARACHVVLPQQQLLSRQKRQLLLARTPAAGCGGALHRLPVPPARRPAFGLFKGFSLGSWPWWCTATGTSPSPRALPLAGSKCSLRVTANERTVAGTGSAALQPEAAAPPTLAAVRVVTRDAASHAAGAGTTPPGERPRESSRSPRRRGPR